MIGEKKTFAADPLYFPGSTRLDPITGVTTGAFNHFAAAAGISTTIAHFFLLIR